MRTTIDSPADTIKWMDDQIRTVQYEPLGKVWAIILEAARDAAVPQQIVTDVQGVRMDFYGQDNRTGRDYMPRIAQTKDRMNLLLLDPLINQSGKVGLPDIPDPTWTPPLPKADEISWDPSKHPIGAKPPKYTPPTAPMLKQKLEERARGRLETTEYLVFGPISQILIRPEGVPEGWILQCGADIAGGKAMEMLVSMRTGQVYFYGGRYQITRPTGA